MVPIALLAGTIAGCGGHDDSYAGLRRDDARTDARAYVQKLDPRETLISPEDVRSRTPGGRPAWLVRVPFEGDSSDACVYVWREIQLESI